jgi:DUF1680 family protein
MRQHNEFSRRQILGAAATACAAALPSRGAEQREKLRELPYAGVKLTGGPLQSQYQRIHSSFLALDNDRLLKVYRQRAGLPAPGEDMGGWYDADGFVPGHTLGQYISGLARFAIATGDAPTAQKVRALVEGFGATLGPGGYPYASAKASTTWPCYILDKYVIGLIDAYRLSGVEQARELLPRVIGGAVPYIPDHTYDRTPDSPKQAPYDEPYILPENLFQAHEVTGDSTHLEMARRYLLDGPFFDPLARGENILPGKHAYSHTIALSSGAKAYLALGEPKYLDAIRNAFDMLASSQQYASGGSGPAETFVPPGQGKLKESLTATHNHFETPCGCYAHMKLARYLLRITGESRYGDGLERVLYNTILGARDPDGAGNFFYYSDYHPRAKKTYYHRKWPCCSGTLVQTVADYGISAYFQATDGIYVNLFTPSEARLNINGVPVKLTQHTGYPLDGAIEVRVDPAASREFAVHLRMPGWLRSQPEVSVNGKRFDGPALPGTFTQIRRRWKKNDAIHVTFPLDVRTEPIDSKNPDIVAVMRGPLMMVGIDPASDGFPLFEAGARQNFKPFYAVEDEIYSTYFRVA